MLIDVYDFLLLHTFAGSLFTSDWIELGAYKSPISRHNNTRMKGMQATEDAKVDSLKTTRAGPPIKI